MTWVSVHTGAPTDAKWLVISAEAQCTPGEVFALWVALLAHARQQTPRGLVSGFDVAAHAMFYRWEPDLVRRVIDILCRDLATEGRLRKWDQHQPKAKVDRTAAERKSRQRARESDYVTPMSRRDKPVTPMSRRDVTRHAPSRLGGDKGGGAVASKASSFSNLDTLTNPSFAAATREGMDSGEIWKALEQSGISPNMIGRLQHRSTLREWASQGLTIEQFDAAIARARAARKRDQSSAPLNVGYLAAFINEVLSGKPEGRSHGHERGDASVDAYANSRR